MDARQPPDTCAQFKLIPAAAGFSLIESDADYLPKMACGYESPDRLQIENQIVQGRVAARRHVAEFLALVAICRAHQSGLDTRYAPS